MTDTTFPEISVVIPSLDGVRGGCVPKLLASIERQRYPKFNVEVVKGVSPQGRAINLGVRRTRGEIVVIVDDDAELADEKVFASLVETLRSDAAIGMAGASILVNPAANSFQRRAAREFPRLCTPEVTAVTDSDLACHGCCAIPRRVFESVGGEREDLLRGLDPDLRVRLRNAGYRVVLSPGARIYHPLPNGYRALCRTFFRNGFGSAYAQKYQPDAVYETHEEVSSATFKPRRSLAYRAIRFPLRLAKAMASGQFLRFAGYCAYSIGYAWGMFAARPIQPAGGDDGTRCADSD